MCIPSMMARLKKSLLSAVDASAYRVDPVNAATGSFSESFTDLAVPGRGGGLSVTRTYDSLAAVDTTTPPGIFGTGWASPFDQHLDLSQVTATDPLVTWVQETGAQAAFAGDGTGAWAPLDGMTEATLTQTGTGSSATWTATLQDGTAYGFDSSGRLTSITDRDGYVTTLTWTSSSLTVSDSNATWGLARLSVLDVRVELFGAGDVGDRSCGRTITYGYTSGQVSSATSLTGGQWNYGYSTKLLTTIQDPATRDDDNQYDSTGHVTDQWDAEQNRERQTVDDIDTLRLLLHRHPAPPHRHHDHHLPEAGQLDGPPGRGRDVHRRVPDDRHQGVRDERGGHLDLHVRDPGMPTSVTDPNHATVTSTYNDNGWVTTQTDPLGNVTKYGWDATNSSYDNFDVFGDPLTVVTPPRQLNGEVDGGGAPVLRSVTTTNTYTTTGHLASTATPVSGTSGTATTTYTHGDRRAPRRRDRGDATRRHRELDDLHLQRRRRDPHRIPDPGVGHVCDQQLLL